MQNKPDLGRIGVWTGDFWRTDAETTAKAAAELEQLGYGAIWIPGGFGSEVLQAMDGLLAATGRTAIASGILNIWKHDPADVGAWWKGLPAAKQERVMLGLGVSHALLIGEQYAKPLQVMRTFLDGLDAAGVPASAHCLAALGPKMLELARDRSGGSHPYLATPEHTAAARRILGPGALLAPEQGVVLETDPAKARAIAREAVGVYLPMANYVNNWLRLGFSEDEVKTTSDRFIDAVFAWGDVAAIGRRVEAHLAAGADHVCLQVLRARNPADKSPALPEWRALAALL